MTLVEPVSISVSLKQDLTGMSPKGVQPSFKANHNFPLNHAASRTRVSPVSIMGLLPGCVPGTVIETEGDMVRMVGVVPPIGAGGIPVSANSLIVLVASSVVVTPALTIYSTCVELRDFTG